MLRPISARFQTALTFMLYVHRRITEGDDPDVRYRAGVMRTSAEGGFGGRNRRSRVSSRAQSERWDNCPLGQSASGGCVAASPL